MIIPRMTKKWISLQWMRFKGMIFHLLGAYPFLLSYVVVVGTNSKILNCHIRAKP